MGSGRAEGPVTIVCVCARDEIGERSPGMRWGTEEPADRKKNSGKYETTKDESGVGSMRGGGLGQRKRSSMGWVLQFCGKTSGMAR